MKYKKLVIIIGGGVMGTSIAKRFLNNDYEVHLFNRFSKSRFKSIGEEIKKKNYSNFFLHESFNNLPWTVSTFIIETVKEELVLKKKIFKQIVNKVSNSTVIASNSSSFGISKISKNLSNPNRFIGCHFFMPADLVPLVELIMGNSTTEHVYKLVKNIMTSIGCVPIKVNKEVPGFIGNRLQHAMLREAFSLIEKKIIEPEDIDKAVKYGFGFRYISNGPILQKEISGLDVHYLAAKEIYKSLNNNKTPSKILHAKIKQGHFGIKTNIGFWKWNNIAKTKIINSFKKNLIKAIDLLNLKKSNN
jgi:3-hydroxybutyryl-CoA dehydrogenase